MQPGLQGSVDTPYPLAEATPRHPRRSGPWGSALAGFLLVAAGFAIGPTLTMAERSTAAAAGETVRAIRGAVDYHRGDATIRTSSTGWPMSISPSWFAGRDMPSHPLTGDALRVEVVDDLASHLAPERKTFDRHAGEGASLWYNRTNGAVCLRVPMVADPKACLDRFNELNGMDLGSLDARR